MAAKWMSLTLALETTVHEQTSTALCLRMMCSLYPSSPDYEITTAASRVEADTPSSEDRNPCLHPWAPQERSVAPGCHKIKSSWFLPGPISLWMVTAMPLTASVMRP